MIQKKTYDYTVDGFCMKKGFSSDNHATWSNKQLFIVSSLATKLSTKGFLSHWICSRNEETLKWGLILVLITVGMVVY